MTYYGRAPQPPLSLLIIVGGLVAVGALVLGAALVTSADPDTARLGLLLAAIAPSAVGLVAALRSEQARGHAQRAEEQTNGSLDARIAAHTAAAVAEALQARRSTDSVVVHEAEVGRAPATTQPHPDPLDVTG